MSLGLNDAKGMVTLLKERLSSLQLPNFFYPSLCEFLYSSLDDAKVMVMLLKVRSSFCSYKHEHLSPCGAAFFACKAPWALSAVNRVEIGIAVKGLLVVKRPLTVPVHRLVCLRWGAV